MSALKLISLMLVSFILYCIPTPHFLSERLKAPTFTTIECAVKKDQSGYFIEAIYLKWCVPENDSQNVQYYTLLRKLPGDSVFDIFTLSQRIPSSIIEFSDPLPANNFSKDLFDTICYKVIAVDDFGRLGDTSQACTLIIAPQPEYDSFDNTTNVLKWKSWVRGSQSSYARIWTDSIEKNWSSQRIENYPRTDEPAVFAITVPDSVVKLEKTRFYFAFFLEVSDTRSIRTGYFDVK